MIIHAIFIELKSFISFSFSISVCSLEISILKLILWRVAISCNSDVFLFNNSFSEIFNFNFSNKIFL